MSIDKKVKGVIKIVGIPSAVVVAGVSLMALLNMYHYHNVSYEIEGKKVFQKSDGVTGHTAVTLNEDGSIDVNRFSMFGDTRFYTDKDGDGNVDIIYKIASLFERGGHSREFYRDEHLKQYPQTFQAANLDFREQIKRFKPYINK